MTCGRARFALLLTPSLLFAAVVDESDRSIIQLRGGGEPIEAPIVSESSDGVEIKEGSKGISRQLRWDQIQAIVGGAENSSRQRWLELGGLLWRGRTRLARLDSVGARECFVAALKQVDPVSTISRLIAQEGIARTAAVEPDDWSRSLESSLSAAALRTRMANADLWVLDASAQERKFGLVMSVTPTWLDVDSSTRAKESLAVAADRARTAGDGMLAQWLGCASRIAAADAGVPAEPAPVRRDANGSQIEYKGSTGQSIAAARSMTTLLSFWADAVSTDAATRKRSRKELEKFASSTEGMPRLWALYAEGRSLAMEPDPDDVRMGVGKMLLITAAYSAEAPRLAQTALAQSAFALDRIQDPRSAERVRAVLREYEGTGDSDSDEESKGGS